MADPIRSGDSVTFNLTRKGTPVKLSRFTGPKVRVSLLSGTNVRDVYEDIFSGEEIQIENPWSLPLDLQIRSGFAPPPPPPPPPPVRVELYYHPYKAGWLIAHGEGAEYSYEFENASIAWINHRLYLSSVAGFERVPPDEEFSIRNKTGVPYTFRNRFVSY